MVEQALQHLAAAGPLALVLGIAVWKLWQANIKKDERIEGLYKELITTVRELSDAIMKAKR